MGSLFLAAQIDINASQTLDMQGRGHYGRTITILEKSDNSLRHGKIRAKSANVNTNDLRSQLISPHTGLKYQLNYITQ